MGLQSQYIISQDNFLSYQTIRSVRKWTILPRHFWLGLNEWLSHGGRDEWTWVSCERSTFVRKNFLLDEEGAFKKGTRSLKCIGKMSSCLKNPWNFRWFTTFWAKEILWEGKCNHSSLIQKLRERTFAREKKNVINVFDWLLFLGKNNGKCLYSEHLFF